MALRRSATIDACATVNESVAPNEYSVPTNVTLPGRMTQIGAIPAKITIDSHGVLNVGCRRRKISGICR